MVGVDSLGRFPRWRTPPVLSVLLHPAICHIFSRGESITLGSPKGPGSRNRERTHTL